MNRRPVLLAAFARSSAAAATPSVPTLIGTVASRDDEGPGLGARPDYPGCKGEAGESGEGDAC
jgi:hypothetical protein